jgi:hypothetical protein
MLPNRFATEIVKETVSAIGTVGVAVADEMMTMAPEKDIMRATLTTIRGASEDTDTSHPTSFHQSTMVCWVGIVLSNFLQLYPFLAEGKILQQAIARPTHFENISSNGFCNTTTAATPPPPPPSPPPSHHHLGMLWSTDSLHKREYQSIQS